MATPQAAFGAILQAGNGASPEVFTNIALVADISGPSIKKDTADASTHDMTDRFKRWVTTLIDAGECKFKLYLDPSDATQNGAAGTAGTTPAGVFYQVSNSGALTSNAGRINWRIVLPVSPAAKYAFNGEMVSFDSKLPVNGIIEADAAIKIYGKTTLG